LALGILTCSFYNAWCEKKSVGMIQSKEFRGLKEVEALEKRNMLIVCTFWDTCYLPKKMIVVVFQNLGKEHIVLLVAHTFFRSCFFLKTKH